MSRRRIGTMAAAIFLLAGLRSPTAIAQPPGNKLPEPRPEKSIFPLPPFEVPAKADDLEAIDDPAAIKPAAVKLAPVAIPTLEPSRRLGDSRFVGPSVEGRIVTSDKAEVAAFIGDVGMRPYTGWHNAVIVWDVKNQRPIRRLDRPRSQYEKIEQLAIAPDGLRLFAGGSLNRLDADGMPLQVWEIATGKLVRLRPKTGLWALSADGKTLATIDVHVGTFDRMDPNEVEVPWRSTLTFWNVADFSPRKSFMYTSLVPNALALAPDGSKAVLGDNKDAIAVDAVSGAILWRQTVLADKGWHRRLQFAFSPDGERLAAAAHETRPESCLIRLIDTATGKMRTLGDWARPVRGGEPEIRDLRFSPEGRWLYVTLPHCVMPIETATGDLPAPRPPIPDLQRERIDEFGRRDIQPPNTGSLNAFALSRDGSTAFLGGRFESDRCGLRVVDMTTREVRYPPNLGPIAAPSPAEGFPTPNRALEPIYPQRVRLPDNGTVEWNWSAKSFSVVRKTRQFKIPGTNVQGHVVTSDGETLITHELAEGKREVNNRHLVFTDLATGFEWGTIPGLNWQRGSGWRMIAVSPDGRMLAEIHSDDESIWIWEVAALKPRLRLASEERSGKRREILSFTFADDSKSLLSNDYDAQTGLFWNFADAFGPARTVEGEHLDSLWTELKGDDAARAYEAIWKLARSPRTALRFLAEKAEGETTVAGLDARPYPPEIVRARRIVEAIELMGDLEALVVLTRLADSDAIQFKEPAKAALRRLRAVVK